MLIAVTLGILSDLEVLSQISKDKHRVEAELKAEQSNLSRAMEEVSSERTRLNSELNKAREAETDAVREAREAQKRARDASAAKDVIHLQADKRSLPEPCVKLCSVSFQYGSLSNVREKL